MYYIQVNIEIHQDFIKLILEDFHRKMMLIDLFLN